MALAGSVEAYKALLANQKMGANDPALQTAKETAENTKKMVKATEDNNSLLRELKNEGGALSQYMINKFITIKNPADAGGIIE